MTPSCKAEGSNGRRIADMSCRKGGGSMKKAAIIISVIILLLGGASLGAFYFLNNTSAGIAFMTADKLKKVESVTADIQMDMTVETEVSGLAGLLSKAFDGTVSLDGTLDMTMKKNEARTLHGNFNLNFLGFEIKDAVETVCIMDQGGIEDYVRRNQIWYKVTDDTTLPKTSDIKVSEVVGAVLSKKIDAKLGEDAVVNGAGCRTMNVTLDGEMVRDVIGLERAELLNIDWEKEDIPATLYIDKKTKLPARIELEMGDLADASMKLSYVDLTLTVDTMKVTIDFDGYNQSEPVSAPEEYKVFSELTDLEKGQMILDILGISW